MTTTHDGATEPTRSPMRQLFGDDNFRRFFTAQLLFNLAGGTTRFAFAYFVVQLSDWPSAEGLVIIALGLPALFLSIPAGALIDRVDRKRLYLTGAGCAAAALFVVAALTSVGITTPRWLAFIAVFIGAATTFVGPLVSAVVPDLVPAERIMNAAALQNGGSMAAQFVGAVTTGIIFDVAGEAAGFYFLAAMATLAVTGMTRVHFPNADRSGEPTETTIGADIMAGLRYGFGSEPLRSLLVVTIILGSSFSVLQTTMPRVVEEIYLRDGRSAGFIVSVFGVGMLISSGFIAGRDNMRHGRNVAIFIGVGLGLGQLLVSLQSNYWLAVLAMIAWGANAGIAMASHRTLLQTQTEAPMMGRVMGIMMLGFAGGLPIGAALSALLTPRLGLQETMTWVGAVTIAFTAPLLWRRVIRTL